MIVIVQYFSYKKLMYILKTINIIFQVSELPYPFESVTDYEASIRAPIGNTWVPETAHRKLIAPRIVTLQGQIIAPMTEDALCEVQG